MPFVSLSIRTRGTCSTPPQSEPDCNNVMYPPNLQPRGANLPCFQVNDRFPVVAVPRPQIQMPCQFASLRNACSFANTPQPRSTSNLRATLAMDVAWICAARSVGVVAS